MFKCWLFGNKTPGTPAQIAELAEKMALKKCTLEIEYIDTKMEVGITKVLLTFKDRQTLTQNIYGKYDQWIKMGNYEEYSCYSPKRVIPMDEPAVGIGKIVNSLKEAQTYIKYNIPKGSSTFVDDLNNPTRSMVGEVISARIGKTLPFTKTVKVAKLVPNKEI